MSRPLERGSVVGAARTGTVVPLLLLALVGLPAMVGGCIDEDDPCDGWVYRDDGCYPPDDGGVDAVAADADGDAVAGDAAAEDAVTLPAGMGDPCTTSPECTQVADYCAFNPMAGTGYCTLQGCALDPDDCPPGWKCWDAPSAMPGMGLPTMCVTEEDWEAMNP